MFQGKTKLEISKYSLLVKKPRQGADYTKYIKSTLYSPAKQYPILSQESYSGFEPKPNIVAIAPKSCDGLRKVPTKFGHAVIGSVISYQQKFSEDYLINNYAFTSFPHLPLSGADESFENIVNTCLQRDKVSMEALGLSRQAAIDVEERTRMQSQSNLWKMLRSKRITTSRFGFVAKRRSGFENLVTRLTTTRRVVTAAMQRGLDFESRATYIYASLAMQNEVNIFPSGLIINPKCPWLGCSPGFNWAEVV